MVMNIYQTVKETATSDKLTHTQGFPAPITPRTIDEKIFVSMKSLFAVYFPRHL
jgi:hypothetical protein